MEYLAIITRGFLRFAGVLDMLLVATRGYRAGAPPPPPPPPPKDAKTYALAGGATTYSDGGPKTYSLADGERTYDP